jgi:sulfoacetaldehyde dehydrogenase
MWPDGKLSSQAIGQSASQVAAAAGLDEVASRRPGMLLVLEDGVGAVHPFSGEKLSPVLAVYRARDFEDACALVARIYSFRALAIPVGLHSRLADRALHLGAQRAGIPRHRGQAHCFATGGSFDNGLPFSLSMGCGTWGGTTSAITWGVRHYMNVTRISRANPGARTDGGGAAGDFFSRFGR